MDGKMSMYVPSYRCGVLGGGQRREPHSRLGEAALTV